jgi:hypothetical protein
MSPEEQLKRLETWYEALVSGEYRQAVGDYWKHDYARCCLNVANEVLGGDHARREGGAYEMLGLDRDDDVPAFEGLNDGLAMTFHEIADVVLTEGINRLRAAMGLEPYYEGEEA